MQSNILKLFLIIPILLAASSSLSSDQDRKRLNFEAPKFKMPTFTSTMPRPLEIPTLKLIPNSLLVAVQQCSGLSKVSNQHAGALTYNTEAVKSCPALKSFGKSLHGISTCIAREEAVHHGFMARSWKEFLITGTSCYKYPGQHRSCNTDSALREQRVYLFCLDKCSKG